MGFEYKKYYNDELQKKLDKKITKSKYGELKFVIDEYFQRRAYEFKEFSDYDVDNEIKNFVQRVKSVKFDPNYRTLAAYQKINIGFGRLIFNARQIEGLTTEELMETFFHEINHVVNDRGGRNQGIINGIPFKELVRSEYKFALTGETTDFKKYGRGLDEIFTEATALRLVFGGDADKYQIDGLGYPLISFASSMLSAAIGITEKELIYASNQPRETFLQKVFDNFQKEDQEQAQVAFFEFERKINEIYDRMYQTKDERAVQPSDIGILINNAYKIAKVQISSDSKNNMSSEKMASYIYRTNRMEKIAEKEIEKIVELIDFKPENTSQIRKYYEDSKKETTDLVYDIYRKNPEHTDITQEQYRAIVQKEDFDSGKKWNNESVAGKFLEVASKKEGIRTFGNFFDKIKMMLQRMRVPKLEAGKGEDKLPDNLSQYRVTVPVLTHEQVSRSLDRNEKDTRNTSEHSIDDDL